MRKLLHLLLSAALWCLFFYYWQIVSAQSVGQGTVLAIKVLAVATVVIFVATVWWVGHNIRISRRNRRQGERPALAEELERDILGRQVSAPPLGALRTAGVIEIEIEPDRKIYRIAQAGVVAGGAPVAVQVSGEDG